jgi:CubicO group peptidase (beta-lactamase class C family)
VQYGSFRPGQAEFLVGELADQIGATAVVVRDRERELLSTGRPSAAVDCRSIRKPLLGALFGRHVADGRIDLNATLVDLGIDDTVPPSLTAAERSAQVRDLLTCRSGIYHPSNHQGARARAALPPRGAHQPGTHFCYNNWDFNALGTILERRSGTSLFDEFADTIAGPIGMQDFDRMKQQYASESWSEHRTYSFRISARDLARFGQLYLCGGQHAGNTVIPREWVTESTRGHAETGLGPAYGYLWWIARTGTLFTGVAVPAGSFAAYGTGSQFLLILPELNRVIALLADPARPDAGNRAAHLPKLALLVHHATHGDVPLAPAPDLADNQAAEPATGPY